MHDFRKMKFLGIFLVLLLTVVGCSNNAVPTTAPLTKVEDSTQIQTPDQQVTTPVNETSKSSEEPSTAKDVVEPKSAPVVAPSPTPPPAVTPDPTPSTPPVVTPTPAPKPTNQTVTVYITKTGEKYHRDGCRYLSKSKIPISLSDAKLGYGPCSVCNPPQ